ncbi:MAG: fructosamine kinase family protein [Verrucomicrobiales bacterium]
MSWRAISRWLFGSGEARVRPAGGGCINDAAVLEVPGKAPLFVKRNAAAQLPMFEAEAFGLRVLRDAGAIRVPEPVAFGTEGGSAFLALEFLPLGARTPEREREMGRQVARLHRCAGSGSRFGFSIDNRIGEAPQRNAWRDSWVGFYRECLPDRRSRGLRRRGCASGGGGADGAAR